MSDFSDLAARAADEIRLATQGVDPASLTALVRELAGARRIVAYGVGREGLMMRALAMRLYHLGLDAHVVGDMSAPPVGPGDLLLVSAGPGSFSTVNGLIGVARGAGARIACVTAQPGGTAPRACDVVLVIPAQTMADDQAPNPASVLPMGSLFEGAQYLTFELLILALRDHIGADPAAMRARHTNLEQAMADWIKRFSLEGRKAMVTGASKGIGAEIARVFADAGADIVAVARDEAGLAETAAAVRAQGRRCLTISAELADPAACTAAAERALAEWGTIDILVNSAGISRTGPAETFSLAAWDETMAVNLRAPFLLSQALAPAMIAQRWGKIVNISSQTGVIALDDHAAYASSKGGLNALTKSLCAEWARHNVQVNAICPTVVLTPMGIQVWSPPEKSGPMIAGTPLRRFGEAVEIADAALYLASPAAELVNGAILMIEGGYSSV